MTGVVLTVTAGPAARPAALVLVLLLAVLAAHHRPRPTATSDHTTTKGGRPGQDGATTPNQHPPQGPCACAPRGRDSLPPTP